MRMWEWLRNTNIAADIRLSHRSDGEKGKSMYEKYRYRGRAKKTWYYPVEENWIYFGAYNDSDARITFRELTGLCASNGDEIEIEWYDSDCKIWEEVI